MTASMRRDRFALGRGIARAVVGVLLPMYSAACRTTSAAPRDFQRFYSLNGISASIVMQDARRHDGELLAVDDSAFVLLEHDRVAIARFGEIRTVTFNERGAEWLVLTQSPSPAILARVRSSSRFPYGIAPTAMTALLAASKQDKPDDLGRKTP